MKIGGYEYFQKWHYTAPRLKSLRRFLSSPLFRNIGPRVALNASQARITQLSTGCINYIISLLQCDTSLPCTGLSDIGKLFLASDEEIERGEIETPGSVVIVLLFDITYTCPIRPISYLLRFWSLRRWRPIATRAPFRRSRGATAAACACSPRPLPRLPSTLPQHRRQHI